MKFTYFRGLQMYVYRSPAKPNTPPELQKVNSFTMTHLKLAKQPARQNIVANYVRTLPGRFVVGTYTIAEGIEIAKTLGVPFISAKNSLTIRKATFDQLERGEISGVVMTFALAKVAGYNCCPIANFVSTVYYGTYEAFARIASTFSVHEFHQVIDNVDIKNTVPNMVQRALKLPHNIIVENVESRQCLEFANGR